MGKKKIEADRIRKAISFLCVFCYVFLYLSIIIKFYHNDNEYDFGIRGYIVLSSLYLLVLLSLLKEFNALKIEMYNLFDIIFSNIISLFFSNIFAYLVLSLIEGHLVILKYHIYLLLFQSCLSFIYGYFGAKIIKKYSKNNRTILVYGNMQYHNFKSKIIESLKNKFNIEDEIYEENVDFKNIANFNSVITYDVCYEAKKKIAKICFENDMCLYNVPSILDIFIKSSEMLNIIDTPILIINRNRISTTKKIIKRIFDIIFSLLLLIISLPIMIITSIIIKTQDGGDIFYKQKRLTLNGKKFYLYKFRSMIMNAEPNGKPIRARENDNRITPFGKFIRSTRIDELPQVINILKGDLSFVGPRALRVEEYEENKEKFPEFRYRLKVKAGLTGYAQVYGKYNTSFKDKLLLDIFYIENYSFVLDIKLLLMIFIVIFKKESTEGF